VKPHLRSAPLGIGACPLGSPPPGLGDSNRVKQDSSVVSVSDSDSDSVSDSVSDSDSVSVSVSAA
jgi:hypothetical protein